MPLIANIKTTKQFSQMKNKADGYVLITDTATGNKIHKVLCEKVTSPDFYEKVIMNDGKNGSYAWSDSIGELKGLASDVGRCNVCKP